jgi:hypothetical protein
LAVTYDRLATEGEVPKKDECRRHRQVAFSDFRTRHHCVGLTECEGPDNKSLLLLTTPLSYHVRTFTQNKNNLSQKLKTRLVSQVVTELPLHAWYGVLGHGQLITLIIIRGETALCLRQFWMDEVAS